jgi:agmatinase
VIDPLERWRRYGEKPDYAGLLTFGSLPYTQDPAELEGVDVAIVGAPTDDLVSTGRARASARVRFARRAVRRGRTSRRRSTQWPSCGWSTTATRLWSPADAARTHEAIERTVGEVVSAGAIPIVLGGDHSIAEPDIRACARRHGPLGLVHFDTHTDTGTEVFGVEVSHGTPMYRLVEQGHIDPKRLRPDRPARLLARAERVRMAGGAWHHQLLHARRAELGIREVVEWTLGVVGAGPTYVTVDVDVLDPAFAPGTGTPEPGGMTSGDLLWACRTVAEQLELVGAEVVEVIPTAVGSADITALVAERIVRELLTGIALRRRG